MKLLSLVAAASLVSSAVGEVFYETRFHYITVDANGNIVGSVISEALAETGLPDLEPASATALAVESDAPDSAPAASTPAANAAPKPTTTTQAAQPATTTSSTAAASSTFAQALADTGSSSGVYAEIGASGVDEKFAKAILDAHNQKRADHSAGQLSWSTEVYKYAQNYANGYECGADLKHSGGKYGENLASGFKDGVSAFDAWYSEGSGYDYASASTFSHFTAIIWKGTTKLGCAYKQCGSDGMYVICSYDPAGNIVGEGKENLSPN
ncbi:putative secreted protein [Clavispora lusitaniae]|uniref:Secreted protein n=1 Tax=Clavispora lusitaniae TaxID=36911 RepID=A0ACD0WST6_CLALS|nr:putative secreted protein [Clavispora lusitaniae]QFZ36184.1 putative secreted protein [Clavispora lusitaniae]QFZ41868.1 putative secreted protein [Clavispora lusitaniae]QFZ47544.1 putative secreted protein [Clavispora lusitaniae]QFZ53223.1 putative secreted protein [Clavispora lusitaniae]